MSAVNSANGLHVEERSIPVDPLDTELLNREITFADRSVLDLFGPQSNQVLTDMVGHGSMTNCLMDKLSNIV